VELTLTTEAVSGEVAAAGEHEPRRAARVAVRDAGQGIPPDALPQLFERFYRVPGREGHQGSGRGLGLSNARELVERQGGSSTSRV
jgi:signal transduction histidine kinase